jgi:hypothetical protein
MFFGISDGGKTWQSATAAGEALIWHTRLSARVFSKGRNHGMCDFRWTWAYPEVPIELRGSSLWDPLYPKDPLHEITGILSFTFHVMSMSSYNSTVYFWRIVRHGVIVGGGRLWYSPEDPLNEIFSPQGSFGPVYIWRVCLGNLRVYSWQTKPGSRRKMVMVIRKTEAKMKQLGQDRRRAALRIRSNNTTRA